MQTTLCDLARTLLALPGLLPPPSSPVPTPYTTSSPCRAQLRTVFERPPQLCRLQHPIFLLDRLPTDPVFPEEKTRISVVRQLPPPYPLCHRVRLYLILKSTTRSQVTPVKTSPPTLHLNPSLELVLRDQGRHANLCPLNPVR